MSNTNNRLQAIEQELKSILESRVNELMSSMRQAETLTRRIVAAETEISQSRQLRENLSPRRLRCRIDSLLRDQVSRSLRHLAIPVMRHECALRRKHGRSRLPLQLCPLVVARSRCL